LKDSADLHRNDLVQTPEPECRRPARQTETDAFLPTRRSLLSRLRRLDDDKSWQDFFDTYWKLIYSAATKAGLPHAEAQDVVQETILTVSRTIQEFRYDPTRGSFKGWLLNTTRWRILDHLRRCKPESSPGPRPADTRSTDVIEQIPDPASAEIEAVWEAEWQQNLMDAAIQRVKQEVKPKHFQIFELYALKGRPAGQVARTFGVNVALVHLIKHRVASQIKKEVKRIEKAGV
jgi:RNA polymerase sigma factor (sigma-70 family)